MTQLNRKSRNPPTDGFLPKKSSTSSSAGKLPAYYKTLVLSYVPISSFSIPFSLIWLNNSNAYTFAHIYE